jgi:hypothetical protein
MMGKNRFLRNNSSLKSNLQYKNVISDIPRNENGFSQLKTLQMMERMQELGNELKVGLEIKLSKKY